MNAQQAKAVFEAIRNALDNHCYDEATSLTTLGAMMCNNPSPELWTRIEDFGGFKLAA